MFTAVEKVRDWTGLHIGGGYRASLRGWSEIELT